MKVAVGLSGGVDSAVASYLLKKKGYEVIGITMVHIENFDIAPVKKVAEHLDIPLYIIDIKKIFHDRIIESFLKKYLEGKTPNPCIMCNPIIKFGILKEYALKYADLFATGHYAIIEKRANKYFIKKGKDLKKDQSYFLYRLKQNDLEKTIFPLGEYIKEEVRKIGIDILKISPKKESQDICFIKEDYKTFIKNYKSFVKGGEFVTKNGKVLGTHKGVPFYTIGQRRGLGVSYTERLYVIKIDSKTNKIVLGKRNELERSEFIICDITSPSYEKIPEDISIKVKVRYNAREKDAKISYISSQCIKVILTKEKEYGVAPGQSAVFYEGDYVVGGGIIT